MVSLRCEMIVKEMLENKALHCTFIDHGLVDILEELTPKELVQLREELGDHGLELLDDPKGILIEKIKNVVIEMVHYCDEFPKEELSEYISSKLNQDYSYLSAIFSEVKGITIGQYLVNHKVERIKELILYEDLSLEEISERLCYTSVSQLSEQLETITGLTPSYFMELKQKRKQTAENLK